MKYGNNNNLHSTRNSIGSTMENAFIINFNNLIDFGILIQHVKVVRNQILLLFERHPSRN